jgi:hypothetical protein
LRYLLQEGYDRDGLSLLLQHNARRVLGLYLRPGDLDGRMHTEPSLATPSAFYIEEIPAFISLALQIPTKVSRRYLLRHNAQVFRNPRGWAAVIPVDIEDDGEQNEENED